jgi:hypothetical protein
LVPDFAAVAAADDGGFRGHGEVGRNSDGDFGRQAISELSLQGSHGVFSRACFIVVSKSLG